MQKRCLSLRRKICPWLMVLLLQGYRDDELVGSPADGLVQLGVIRINAGDAFVTREDHLRTAMLAANDRNAVSAGVISSERFPQCVAIPAAVRHDVGIG